MVNLTFNNTFFLDMQGFLADGHFIIKELAISSYGSDAILSHHIFDPPFEYQKLSKSDKRQAMWLKCFHHGFNWSDGATPYKGFLGIFEEIIPKNATIFVKGAEKIKWLKLLLSASSNCNDNYKSSLYIVNIEDIGFMTSLKDIQLNDYNNPASHCLKHDKLLQCAYKNVLFLKEWFCLQDIPEL